MQKTISLDTITRRAEKQCLQLTPEHRYRVCKALANEIPLKDCTPVKKLRRHQVYHFRVSDTLRVSFSRMGEENCVVNVGIHAEFDKFANHFEGLGSQKIISLEEAVIMKNKINESATVESQPHGRRNSSATANRSTSEGQLETAAMMVEVFSGICQGSIDGSVAPQLASLNDVATDHEGRLDGLDEQTAKVNKILADHRKKFAALRGSSEEWMTREEKLRLCLRTELGSEIQDLKPAFKQGQDELTGTVAAICAEVEQGRSRQQEAAKQWASQAQRLDSLWRQSEAEARRVDRLGQQSEQLNELLGALTLRVASVEVQMMEERKRQEIAEAHRQSGVIHRLKNCLGRISAWRPPATKLGRRMRSLGGYWSQRLRISRG